MIKMWKQSLIIILTFISTFAYTQTPVDLLCEFMPDPVGVDMPQPRLTWKIKTATAGDTSYSCVVMVSEKNNFDKAFTWESPVIQNELLCYYNGPALKPFTKYFWKVAVKDDKVTSGKSNTASFETGMMNISNWKGSWISDPHDQDFKPAGYFRKEFIMPANVKKASLYIAAAGLYECSINGKNITDHRLEPAYTRYDRRNLYQAYDVTSFLNAGTNAVGIIMGNGWYNHQSIAVWDFHNAPWRQRPAFCLNIRIEKTDGSVEWVATGKDWKYNTGPVIFNSIYTAEHTDARINIKGWNLSGYKDSAWQPVIIRSAPSQKIVAGLMHPVRVVNTLQAVSVTKINPLKYVFKFPENIAGCSRLKIEGKAGTVATLKHGELLYKNGTVNQENISVHYRPRDSTDPFQTDIFILSGNGEDVFYPKFNYKGFQYVELSLSAPALITKNSLTALKMHSDVPAIGTLQTSDPLINKIWKATNNAYLANLFGYPTDCPQREKNGWTGDAHIAIETGLYNFDAITIYEKWMNDHQDEQQPSGVLPSIIPTGGWGYEWGNGPDWTSTIAIIPWTIYKFYGDKKILEDNYMAMKKYADLLNDRYPTGLTDWGLGDWVPVRSKSPVELTSTVYYYTDVLIVAKVAKVLGKQEDAEKYLALSEKIKAAFNKKYFDREKALYGSGKQTELSVPLYWGLVPDEYRLKVAQSLARQIEKDSMKLDVGILGCKVVLNALSENGYADLAYKIASSDQFPSWGWWIKNGATTLYENWRVDATQDISLNHIMFGDIGAWFYKNLGGIYADEDEPGFKNIILKPKFVQGLDNSDITFNGPRGRIVSSWKKTGRLIYYTVEVPPVSTAKLTLPYSDTKGNITYRLQQGKYTFLLQAPDSGK